jgi:hypothetical protein
MEWLILVVAAVLAVCYFWPGLLPGILEVLIDIFGDD